jgi:LL-diaminopimelate aminotransferase
VHVPLDPADGFLPDLDAVRARASETKIMWLGYPNNPTASVAPLSAIERWVGFAHQHGIWLVHDNPYSTVTFDGVRAPSVLEVDGAREVAVEFNSLSKTYNMTGWRIGMAAGCRTLIDAIVKVKESTDTGIFAAVQLAGAAALEGPQDVIDRTVAIYQRRRDFVVDALRGAGVDVAPPKGTFYIWVPAPGGSGSVFAEQLLEQAGVVVIPGIAYGAQGAGFVRLSLSVPDDRLEEAIVRLTAAIATAGNAS